jgi:hypothetical protein
MIAVELTLDVGKLEDGKLEAEDSFDMQTHPGATHLWECESVNSLLSFSDNDDLCNYAELFLSITNTDIKYLIASFKKIKLKGKGHKWILVD